MVALDRIMSGAPFSARKLAAYCGWSRWHSTQILKNAKTFLVEWDQPHVAAGNRPPQYSYSNNLQNETDPNPASRQPDSSHRGRDNKPTDTEHEHLTDTDNVEKSEEAEQAVQVKSDTIDLKALYDQMEDTRLQVVPGTKRGRLGKRRETLRIRVAEHGVDAILHAWRWFWYSTDQRAQFLRDGGYGATTFLRAKNLREYVELSSNWSPEKQQKIEDWYTDDDFDEHGNLIVQGV
tara:strand:- start:197 stop:901 length:705 start_codon:yes stop_codon:yes gene_type:complete